MNKEDKVYIAGHNGMVGSALSRRLIQLGIKNIIKKTSNELDLRDQQKVNNFFKIQQPDYVFLAAAKAKGEFNSFPIIGEVVAFSIIFFNSKQCFKRKTNSSVATS